LDQSPPGSKYERRRGRHVEHRVARHERHNDRLRGSRVSDEPANESGVRLANMTLEARRKQHQMPLRCLTHLANPSERGAGKFDS
jgi:hypothetical protein